ncbi:hypothetical protein FBY31_1720 [Arthrobacter sp. SLBN-100]|uniref:hypothetical protein n=1 Tax=Arthrobacter sp. SLBN-100 TaxID=2768450 RepID=UPI00115313E3|nr:hypothetical protein [Arthrobacter sp. SLBN-100]TQJ67646.1 hypothetical protein FBY31_1720 [Arthrobacter sp. SLBN-100]
MSDKNEQAPKEPHEHSTGNGAKKDSEYYASKSGSRQDAGEGGHARRRLDEMLSQRVPDLPDSEEEPDEDLEAETRPSGRASTPSEKEQPDKGAPDEG